MRIGVLGINHKLASLELRETIASACNKFFGSEKIVHAGVASVLLSTCNRTEVYFMSEEPAVTHSYILNLLREEVEIEFEQKIYSFFGYDCFYHLVRVTAGLDSAIIAETEIQGQVRVCYENTARLHTLPSELHFIFQKSLQIAKQVRHNQLGQYCNSTLEQMMWRLCIDHSLNNPKVLFIGASQINIKSLYYFKRKGFNDLSMCNRTDAKAKAIAIASESTYLSWDARNNWNDFDAVICATKSPAPLILPGKEDEIRTKIFFDLSVPRNVATELAKSALLFDIDQLQGMVRQRQSHMECAVHIAEDHIAQATLCHMHSWQHRDYVRRQLAFA